MRDVEYGDIIRYLHSTGASAFFVVVYLHMFRALAYGSYRAPRGTAVAHRHGHLPRAHDGRLLRLPAALGQHVLLGCPGHRFPGRRDTVHRAGSHGVGARRLPDVRDYAESVLRPARGRPCRWHSLGSYSCTSSRCIMSDRTIRTASRSSRTRTKAASPRTASRSIPTTPCTTSKRRWCSCSSSVPWCSSRPRCSGYFLEKPNFERADPLKTPDLIAPVWYFTPFYSMLRASTFPLFGLTAKFWGLVVMGAAILIPMMLPWLDRSPVKSMRYKGWISKVMLALFVVSFFVLGYLGTIHATPLTTAIAQGWQRSSISPTSSSCLGIRASKRRSHRRSA